jgi:hypothetical protein
MIYNQDTFSAASVELAVKNLFPRAEVQFALGDRHHDLAARDA